MRITSFIVGAFVALATQGCKKSVRGVIDEALADSNMTPEQIAAFNAELEVRAAQAVYYPEFPAMRAAAKKEGASTADAQLGFAFAQLAAERGLIKA